MSVLSQCLSIIIYRGISAPRHGKEVVNGIYTIEKRYIYQLISNVQLPGSKIFESQNLINSFTQKNYVSLDKKIPKTSV